MSIATVGDKCTGCRTCVSVCPKKVIKMVEDDFGYEYPKVNLKLCVECGLCEKVCPAIHAESKNECLRCGAAYALDAQTKFDGSSGGMFGVIAKSIIAEGGIVFGAAFDENLELKTTSADTIEGLQPLYKSKYLLCDTNNQFTSIKIELKKGRKVLYCSSPCQISALKHYLGKDYDNLILLDFVCHGVGSQSLFNKSVRYIENRIKGTIKSFSFRFKKSNASSHYYYDYCYWSKNRMEHKIGIYMQFPYYYAYHKYIIYRDSCYDCQYASEHRQGDITLADFHTINKYIKDLDRFAGVSMFVCNTKRGLDIIKKLNDYIRVIEMSWDEVKNNNRFGGLEPKKPLRYAFLNSLKNEDFCTTVKKYLNYKKDWRYFYYMCPKIIRTLGIKLLKK